MMNEANIATLDQLCDLRLVEICGVLVRLAPGEEDMEELHRTVLTWIQKESEPERVERVLNHLHVYDAFEDLSEDEYDAVAAKLFACWNEAVGEIDKTIRVEKYQDYGPTLTLYRSRQRTGA